MASETRFVLGLGSNLGDRLAWLRAAAARLEAPDVRVIARSHVVETPPAGGPPQGPYLNAAVLVETALDPAALLARALDAERALGRVRPDAVRWGPRTIDIDVLWWSAGSHRREPEIPHPRLRERPFALQPLLALVPDAADARGPLAAVAGPPLPAVAQL